MNFTNEQLDAIQKEGTNIIVSAGAGSGKTAVLTERVFRKVKSGINIDKLLVLTFTNAAAQSMKNKIRKRLKKDNTLSHQLELIDNAYITTFDSYALSIVKKYHTYLNITNNINITDEGIISIEKTNILDNIFNELYDNPTNKFKKLIHDFCLKKDDTLKNYILNIYSKLELKSNKTEYINNYINNYLNDNYVSKVVNDYIELIKEHINNMKLILDDIEVYFEGSQYEKYYSSIINLLNSNSYDEIKLHSNITLPVLRNLTNNQKNIKDNLKKELDKVKELTSYQDINSMKEEILTTKDNIEVIIDILKELNNRLTNYKTNTNSYTFTDIAVMAINVVKENEIVRNELINSYNEILIDEYQDTSDLQEEFISLISNNNVYMVGDIKQSIYRFRNANPYIFKDKYDNYSKNNNGIKIDLLNNFRSREEVLNNINLIFNSIMNDEIGGANYKESHNMIFGNKSYNIEGKTNQNNNLSIIEYERNDNKYSKEEYEAFIIGNDIKNKINSNYQIFDKENKILRDCNYNDFVILIDKSTSFDLYKQIFEYLGIPLNIIKDTSLTKDNDLYVIQNLIKLIIYVKDNNLNTDYKHVFISICRSFLYKLSDEEIFNINKNNLYKETELYNKCLELSKYIDNTSPNDYYNLVLDEFDYDEKLLTISNINKHIITREYIYNLIKDYSETGKNIYEFINYLDDIFDKELDLRYKTYKDNTNSVRIMTIHTSKGLEFPICYFSLFTSKFNLREITDRIFYDNKYGIVLPKVDNYYKDTIIKTLSKNYIRKEEISERIRLLYVALTRAEEKMIILLPKYEEESIYKEVPDYIKRDYSSFEKIINSINTTIEDYKENTDINPTKDYQNNLKSLSINNLIKTNDTINVNEINIESIKVEESHFSKEKLRHITKEEKELLEFGTKVHEILEYLDFNNPNLEGIDSNLKDKINIFLNTDIIKSNINNTMYKEYEFMYYDDNNLLHGIIDLLIETKDKYIIIDYKLKNIDDQLYDKQLNGYRKYIEEKTNKQVECYLYSILDEKYRRVVNQ